MEYEWDPRKAARNLQKHGVDFADAALALDDENCLTLEDSVSEGEARLISLGLDPFGVLLVVVFTLRGEAVRLISARRATRRERRWYESQK